MPAEILNKSWKKRIYLSTPSIVDIVNLLSIGIICLTGLVGNILIIFTIIRYLALIQPFYLTSWRTRYSTMCINLGLWVASLILALPVWVYSKVIRFKDGVESCAFDLTSRGDVLCYHKGYAEDATSVIPLSRNPYGEQD